MNPCQNLCIFSIKLFSFKKLASVGVGWEEAGGGRGYLKRHEHKLSQFVRNVGLTIT